MLQSAASLPRLATLDPVWDRIRAEAEEAVASEPLLGSFLYATILAQPTLEAAIVHRLASRLENPEVPGDAVRRLYETALTADTGLGQVFRADIAAVLDRDAACNRMIEPVLYFKGFAALQTHRLAHWLWNEKRRDVAFYLQSRSSAVFGVDIHPNARIGRGVMLDHATGIVIGETSVVEDDVSILQNVTLGGTGKETGDRHPKIRRGVLVGVGAKILGNIEVGACARVAAGSVVLKPVPPCKTVAGVPAKVVGDAGCSQPSRTMDHVYDPVI